MNLQDVVQLIRKYRWQWAVCVLATIVVVQFGLLRDAWRPTADSPSAKQKLQDELTYLNHLERIAKESEAEGEKRYDAMVESAVKFKDPELYKGSRDVWEIQNAKQLKDHQAVARQRAKIDKLMETTD